MNDQQTLTVLDQLAELDPERLDADELLTRLGHAIRAASGVARVDLVCVAIEAGESQPLPGASVRSGSSVAEGWNKPARLESLSLSGERPILGDLTPVTGKLFNPEKGGPPSHLLVRVRSARALFWATLELGAGSRDVEGWNRALQRICAAFVGRVELRELSSPRALRRRFFDALLDWRHVEVERDLCKACECWRAAAGADGAILWMYNEAAKSYELVGFDIAGDDPKRPRDELLELRQTPEGDNGVGHFASAIRKPVRIPAIGGWSATHEQRTYGVLLADELERAGCRSLVCVPLLERRDASEVRYLDVVTLHYCRRPFALALNDESLITMGRVTRQFVVSTLSAQERRVQNRLEQLTKNHLARSDAAPRNIRDAYLAELIELIQSELHVDGVSIFFRARFRDWVGCLASTGLVDAQGREVQPNEITTVGYDRGEGWTGECYAANQPILCPSPGRDPHAHVAKYSEIRKGSSAVDQPFLLQPLPTDPTAPDASGGAIGVIRCVGHRSALFRNQYAQFQPAGMELLRRIAISVSPILQTLNLRVEREHTVGIIKHEVSTPLGMILDTSRKILRELEAQKPVREVDVRDIELCSTLAMNLAQQLGADASAQRALRKKEVRLEGDIVARVRAMLSHYARESNQMSIRFGDGFRAIPPLMLDRDLIEQALLNLIVNAIKYGARGSLIEIEARPPDSNARSYVVDVINQGAGVEEDEREKIFLPNYRSPFARRLAAPGVGLGLVIARQAARAHGGDVTLTSARNPTIFSLYVPKSPGLAVP